MTKRLGFAMIAALVLGSSSLASARPAPVLTSHGLGPVRIGMSVVQAQRALHAQLTFDKQDAQSGCTYATRTDGGGRGVFYMLVDSKIARIDVTPDQNAHIRSVKGIGIGTAESQVLAAFGERVKIEPNPSLGEPAHYLTIVDADGKYGLLFETEDGRVTKLRGGEKAAIGSSEGCQ